MKKRKFLSLAWHLGVSYRGSGFLAAPPASAPGGAYSERCPARLGRLCARGTRTRFWLSSAALGEFPPRPVRWTHCGRSSLSRAGPPPPCRRFRRSDGALGSCRPPSQCPPTWVPAAHPGAGPWPARCSTARIRRSLSLRGGSQAPGSGGKGTTEGRKKAQPWGEVKSTENPRIVLANGLCYTALENAVGWFRWTIGNQERTGKNGN